MPRASQTNTNNSTGAEQTPASRLQVEITALRAELESLAEKASSETGDSDWIVRGRELLDKAESALEQDNIEQGWSYFQAAELTKIHGVETVGGEDELQAQARELLVEAEHSPLSWRAKAITKRLRNEDGSLRAVTGNNLRSAYELLHDGYQQIRLKRQHLQNQVKYLKWWALTATLLFVVFGAVSAAVPAVPSPFAEFSASDSTVTIASSQAEPSAFTLYIIVAGMLGASLFGLRSLRTQPVAASTPQYLTGGRTAATRVIVGAGSALAVFFFVHSGLLGVDIGPGLNQGSFLIALGFVAGYSQRVVHATVESVASTAESGLPADETTQSEDTGQRRAPYRQRS